MKLNGVYSHISSGYSNLSIEKPNDFVLIVKTIPTDTLFLWSYIYPSNFCIPIKRPTLLYNLNYFFLRFENIFMESCC